MGGIGERVVQQLQQSKTKYPLILRVAPYLWLLAIGCVTLIWHVGSIGLIDETEPLFVEASRQMSLTGDWITPFFDGETRFDKPPLIYWLMVIAFQFLGVNEFAARLPSVLAAFAIVFLCFHTLRCYGEAAVRHLTSDISGQEHPETPPAAHSPQPQTVLTSHRLIVSASHLPAYLGATMLLLNPNTFFWGRTAYSDMLLTACIGGSLLAFFLGYAQPDNPHRQQRWYFVFYALMGLAVLTKGPIGIVLPGLAIGGFVLYLGNGRELLREMRLLRGGWVVLVIALPWYILVTLANGDAFINSFFGYHNMERFTQVVNHHAGPWYFHFLVILVGFLPWSAYLPAALVRPFRVDISRPWQQRRYWHTQPRFQQLGLFAAFWFVAVLGFFTLATTKYFSYTLPLMPAAAILVALFWTEYITQVATRRQPGFILSSVINLGLLLAMMGAVLYCPQWLSADPWMPNLGLHVQQVGLPVLGGAVWGLTTIAAIALVWRRSHWLWLANLLGFMAFIVLVVHPFVIVADVERQLPLRDIAQTVLRVKQPTEDLVMLGFKKPSLVFYTRQHVTYLTQPAAVIAYLQTQPRDRVGALIVAAERPLEKSGLQPNQYQEISQAGVYHLIRVAK